MIIKIDKALVTVEDDNGHEIGSRMVDNADIRELFRIIKNNLDTSSDIDEAYLRGVRDGKLKIREQVIERVKGLMI